MGQEIHLQPFDSVRVKIRFRMPGVLARTRDKTPDLTEMAHAGRRVRPARTNDGRTLSTARRTPAAIGDLSVSANARRVALARANVYKYQSARVARHGAHRGMTGLGPFSIPKRKMTLHRSS